MRKKTQKYYVHSRSVTKRDRRQPKICVNTDFFLDIPRATFRA